MPADASSISSDPALARAAPYNTAARAPKVVKHHQQQEEDIAVGGTDVDVQVQIDPQIEDSQHQHHHHQQHHQEHDMVIDPIDPMLTEVAQAALALPRPDPQHLDLAHAEPSPVEFQVGEMAQQVNDAPPVKPKKTIARRHVSCEACRAKKMKCSRSYPCASCKMRGEECVWTGGATPNGAADQDELEASQTEIARLNRLLELLKARLEQQGTAPSGSGGEVDALSDASVQQQQQQQQHDVASASASGSGSGGGQAVDTQHGAVDFSFLQNDDWQKAVGSATAST